jgi:type IV secretory pathway VirB2 component (pilin)
MKTLIISLTVLVSSLFIFSQTAFALNGFGACSTGTATTTQVCQHVNSNHGSTDPILTILKTVINLLSYIIGIIAVIVLIVAGIQMVTGGSDPQSITNARNSIIYALVGIAIAVMAKAIVVYVLSNVQ